MPSERCPRRKAPWKTESSRCDLRGFAEILEISRSKTYELIADGSIPSIRIGASVRVPVQSLREWIERQVQPVEQRAAGR